MDLIQLFAFGTALRQGFLADALFAWTFYQISDFEIVFIFETFFWHFLARHNSTILFIFRRTCSSSQLSAVSSPASQAYFHYHKMLRLTSQFRF
jgi:hypothetical protein